MPDRSPALDALIRDAESVAAERPDVLGTLIMLLDMAIRSDTDPYLLASTGRGDGSHGSAADAGRKAGRRIGRGCAAAAG
jgi:hypothetical protein